jgi:hypothetical protein
LGLSPKSFKTKNVAEKLKIRYGKNKTISVRVKGRLDPIFKHFKKKIQHFQTASIGTISGRR